jgi:hypothetical protein
MKNVKPLIVMYSLLLQNLCQNETSDWWLMSPPPQNNSFGRTEFDSLARLCLPRGCIMDYQGPFPYKPEG